MQTDIYLTDPFNSNVFERAWSGDIKAQENYISIKVISYEYFPSVFSNSCIYNIKINNLERRTT